MSSNSAQRHTTALASDLGSIHDIVPLTPRVPLSPSSDFSPSQEPSPAPTVRPRKRRNFVPNYRNFVPEEDPLSPRRFQTSTSAPIFNRTMSSDSLLSAIAPSTPDEDYTILEPNPRHPPQLSQVAADAFNDSISTGLFPGLDEVEARRSDLHSISNLSQSGIVHLGPIDRSSPSRNQPRSTSPSVLRSLSGRETVSTSPIPSSAGDLDGETSQLQSGCPPSPRLGSGVSPVSVPSISDASTGSMTNSSGSSGPQITFRYQHVQDEHGHHLIVGREGTMTKCEDEVCWHVPSDDEPASQIHAYSLSEHRALSKGLVY